MQRNADENSLDVVFDEDPPGKEIPIGYLIGLGFATGSGSLTVFFFLATTRRPTVKTKPTVGATTRPTAATSPPSTRPPPRCSWRCHGRWHPVCGTNRVTYRNECFLVSSFHKCWHNLLIFSIHLMDLLLVELVFQCEPRMIWFRVNEAHEDEEVSTSRHCVSNQSHSGLNLRYAVGMPYRIWIFSWLGWRGYLY